MGQFSNEFTYPGILFVNYTFAGRGAPQGLVSTAAPSALKST
jgi:hypothetical protein